VDSATEDTRVTTAPTSTIPPALARRGDRADPGRSVWYTGALLTFPATGAETGGRFAPVEEVFRKGVTAPPPLHVRSREEESFDVVEGEMTFYVGDAVIPAPAGTPVVLPRGVPHGHALVSDDARLLNLITPAGFEGFFREMGEPARELGPPPTGGPPDRARAAATSAADGVEPVGPPPSAAR
jgi:quercetin dioxygenase-like cupin family protein